MAAETKLPKISRIEIRIVQRTFRVAAFIAPEKIRLTGAGEMAIEAIGGDCAAGDSFPPDHTPGGVAVDASRAFLSRLRTDLTKGSVPSAWPRAACAYVPDACRHSGASSRRPRMPCAQPPAD